METRNIVSDGVLTVFKLSCRRCRMGFCRLIRTDADAKCLVYLIVNQFQPTLFRSFREN
jgi:hypothetical protein